jgi:oral-facial-digital syndrome 1 protein
MIAGTRAAAVAADDKENPAVLAAADALREQVYRRVLSSDVLSSVKAHLRAKLYAELKGGNGSGIISASGDGGLAWQAHALPPARSPTLHQHILNCLVCEYLLIQQHKYTLSVFLSETGSGALPQLSQADILRLVGVLPDSKVHALLTGGGSGGVGSVLSSGAEGGAASAAGAPPRSRCLAESMVEALGSLGSRVSTHNAACQTSTAEASCGGVGAAGGGGSVSSQQLAQRLQAIEAEYCRKSSQLEAAAAQSLEDRMAAYQRDCDARCAAQLQERLAAIREAELAAVREQEAGRHAQLLEAERRGLQQEHQQRLAKLRAQVKRGWLRVLAAWPNDTSRPVSSWQSLYCLGPKCSDASQMHAGCCLTIAVAPAGGRGDGAQPAAAPRAGPAEGGAPALHAGRRGASACLAGRE